MVHQEEVNTETSLNFIFDELQEACTDLLTKFNKVKLINKKLKKQNLSLNHERKKISKKNNLLACKNQKLNDELKKIKSFIEKFIYSFKKLHMLLNE